jgi:hypothetical protein
MTTKRTDVAEPKTGKFTPHLADPTDALGDWIRLPKPKGRLAGLSRSSWVELLEAGKVQGITIRGDRAKRGIRLIFKPSAESFLRGLLSVGGKQ